MDKPVAHVPPGPEERFDFVIAGGGLAGGLVALALAAKRPRARVALIEQAPRLGGQHTWSFHDTDLPGDAWSWMAPVVAHRWETHSVSFPGSERRFSSGYASITSEGFDRVVRARLQAAGFVVHCDDAVTEIGPGLVRTASGRTLRASVVLDGRGPGPVQGACGYQKFLGLEVELERDTPLDGPRLMDATVAQLDGFRFVYVLPFGARRWLVEDTYYADTPDLDRARLRERVHGYLRQRGHHVAAVVREEAGVLPLPFAPAPDGVAARAVAGAPLAIGSRGGWFHPLTGYTVPVAVRLALAIAGAADPSRVAPAVDAAWSQHVRQARLCHWLTRTMFRAVPPAQRWRLLARFYRLPEPTIQRFYALRMTWADRLRLLAGWPPRWLSPRSAARSAPLRSVPSLEEVS